MTSYGDPEKERDKVWLKMEKEINGNQIFTVCMHCSCKCKSNHTSNINKASDHSGSNNSPKLVSDIPALMDLQIPEEIIYKHSKEMKKEEIKDAAKKHTESIPSLMSCVVPNSFIYRHLCDSSVLTQQISLKHKQGFNFLFPTTIFPTPASTFNSTLISHKKM